MYKCNKCSKEFIYNYLLQRHNKKKKSCISILDEQDAHNIKDIETKLLNLDNKLLDINNQISYIENNNNDKIDNSLNMIRCLFCDKNFSSKSNLMRHIKIYCLIYKKIIDEKNLLEINKNNIIEDKKKLLEEKLNRKRDEEIKQLRKDMLKLLKKKATNINITNNTNNNNNKIINNSLVVNINSFGNENLSHITNNDYKKFLSGFFPGFIKFIEKIHFDENVPENHNISITNLKSKYMYIFENGKWTMKEKNELIDHFIAKKYNLLVGKLDELEENNQIDDKVLEKFNKFTKNYQDEEAQKNTKNDIILMLYNNKDKINMKL